MSHYRVSPPARTDAAFLSGLHCFSAAGRPFACLFGNPWQPESVSARRCGCRRALPNGTGGVSDRRLVVVAAQKVFGRTPVLLCCRVRRLCRVTRHEQFISEEGFSHFCSYVLLSLSGPLICCLLTCSVLYFVLCNKTLRCSAARPVNHIKLHVRRDSVGMSPLWILNFPRLCKLSASLIIFCFNNQNLQSN